MAAVQMANQLRTPTTQKFHSPTKRELRRSEEILHQVIFPRVLKQERVHAMSKRPQIRCAAEADIKIQNVLESTQTIKSNIQDLKERFYTLQAKVDKLEIERENGQKHHLIHQLSFSPGTDLSPPLTPTATDDEIVRRITPHRQVKQRPLSLLNLKTSSVMMSPSSPTYLSSSNLMECSRKKSLLHTCLTRLHVEVKTQGEQLQALFEQNFKVLKFRRAEHCLLSMIKLQRKLKSLENNVYQLRDRL